MTAIFSPDRRFRYALWRRWKFLDHLHQVMFVCLNPSTADETNDDPTIRRCIKFAISWGFGSMCMTNLFAFRATDPAMMMSAIDPVGPDNDWHLQSCAKESSLIVAAWGNDGSYRRRDEQVRALLPALQCFGKNKTGQPKHPLYLRGDSYPSAFLVE